MAREAREQRSIAAHSIHGRGLEGVIDYASFFQRLSDVPSVQRQTSVGEELVALATMQEEPDAWILRFLAGQEGVPTIYYDPTTGQESYGESRTAVPVRTALAFVHPESRMFILESRRPGITPGVVAKALSLYGRELNLVDQLTIDLNPVVSESFLQEIDRFERIRAASVSISRPNFNWDDNAVDITEYARESNADDAQLQLTARRGDSLSRTEGIVGDIRELAGERISPIQDARITGRREGEERETSVSTRRHRIRTFFQVRRNAAPTEERTSFTAAAIGLLQQLRESVDD